MRFAHPCFVIKTGVVGVLFACLFVCFFRFGSKYKVHKLYRRSENSVVGSPKQNEREAIMKDREGERQTFLKESRVK